MTLTRLFLFLFVTFVAGACVAPQSRHDGNAMDPHQRNGGECSTVKSASLQKSCATDFLTAPPPRFDGDERTQEEIDLETIGRKN